MSTLQAAIRIAVEAHGDGVDWAGVPFILHPLRVMLALESQPQSTQILGVLHDAIEDTDVTLADLEGRGFHAEVITALGLLTRSASDAYRDYIVRVKGDAIARAVKIADLEDNSNVTRVMIRPGEDEVQDRRRVYRYALSYAFLNSGIDEANYRRLMRDNEES